MDNVTADQALEDVLATNAKPISGVTPTLSAKVIQAIAKDKERLN